MNPDQNLRNFSRLMNPMTTRPTMAVTTQPLEMTLPYVVARNTSVLDGCPLHQEGTLRIRRAVLGIFLSV